jgi:hypothetical protein
LRCVSNDTVMDDLHKQGALDTFLADADELYAEFRKRFEDAKIRQRPNRLVTSIGSWQHILSGCHFASGCAPLLRVLESTRNLAIVQDWDAQVCFPRSRIVSGLLQ